MRPDSSNNFSRLKLKNGSAKPIYSISLKWSVKE